MNTKKWTFIPIAILGVVTYGAIFLAQAQHDDAKPVTEAAPRALEQVVVTPPPAFAAEPVEPAIDSVATVAAPQVSEITNTAPRFEGDAWPAGVAAFETGDYELAAAALEVAVEEKPDSAYRHYLLGLTHRRLGDSEAAVIEFERSLELSPESVRTLVNLGRAQLDVGDTESARTVIERAIELDPTHADGWHLLGRVELTAGDFGAAVTAFVEATDRDPQHAWAWNNTGYAHIQVERFEAAVEPLRRALSLGVEEAVFYNNLGVALERTERPQLAALAYSRAALLGSESAELSYGRVEEILIARGETVPTFDEADAIDAAALAARIEPAVDVEVALEPAVAPDELPVVEDFTDFDANR